MFGTPTTRPNRHRTPAGSNTQIQFNNSGQMGSDPNFIWNKVNDILTIGNSTINSAMNSSMICVGNITATTVGSYLSNNQLIIGNSTVNTTLNTTAWSFGGTSYYDAIPIMSITTTAFTGVSGTAAQNVFASGQRTCTLASSTTYLIDAEYHWTYANSSNINVAISFGNSVAITTIAYSYRFVPNNIANSTNLPLSGWATSNAAMIYPTTICANSTNNCGVTIRGFIETSGAVNITPQFQTVTATGNAPIFAPGTFIKFTPIGNATINATGTWA